MIASRHWCGAALLAVTLHLALAGLLLWQWPKPGAAGLGRGGIEVALGPAGGAPGLPTDGESSTVDEAAAAPASAATSQSPHDPASLPEIVDPVPPVVEEDAPPLPEIATAPQFSPPSPRPKPQPPAPRAAAAAAATDAAAPPAAGAPAMAEAAAAPSGAGGRSGTEDTDEVGSGSGTHAAGGDPGALRDYVAGLQAWLERHKRYPEPARRRGDEGTALLRFTVDREGRVVAHRLERSSGHLVLDEEVAAMIDRAQPLPPMPAAMRRKRLELIVPVGFGLR